MRLAWIPEKGNFEKAHQSLLLWLLPTGMVHAKNVRRRGKAQTYSTNLLGKRASYRARPLQFIADFRDGAPIDSILTA
jgi:hypothetical protein